MSTHSVTYQPINIDQNLPFEIIAVPTHNAYQQPNAFQNWPNQQFNSFKIRIKNKKEPGVKQAAILVPKLNTSYSKKVRLVNSDQTILSFDLFMDPHASKITQNKNQKNFFKMFKPRCLNTQNEDDIDPYTLTTSNGQEKIQNISDNNTDNRNENGPENFALRKTFVSNNTTTKHTDHRFLMGQCKPGGCLDPPYNEDKYPYKPTDNIPPLSLEANIDKKINQDGKFKSRHEVKAIITSEIEAIAINTSIKKVISLQLRDEENEDNMPNPLITYPHAIPSSKINVTRENQNNNTKPRTSSESKPKFLVNELPEVYYMPPKKTKIKRPEAKYNKYENKTPSDESKILNLLIKNDVTTPNPLFESILQSPESIKDDSQLEYENIKETSQQIKNKKIIHNSVQRKTITSNEDSNFENPSTSDNINETHVLPDKHHKDTSELKNLMNIIENSSETQIKTYSKDSNSKYVKDSNIILEVPYISKLSIHELVVSTPIRNSSIILDSKDIDVIYKDVKLFDISLKTSLESLEQIDSGLETNDYELSAISEKDDKNQVNIPILNNNDKQLQINKPEITPERMIENNLANDRKAAVDEILLTNQTSLNKLEEILTDSSLNADNRAPDTDDTITPKNKTISKSRHRQDSTEMRSVLNNDKIKQLKYSPKSFQEPLRTLKVNDINQTEKISLQNLEFQSKEIDTLSSSSDTLSKKSEENSPLNNKLTDANITIVRMEPTEIPKIETKSVHSIENSALEIKHSSSDFMKQNSNASVLNYALNSSVKGSDSKIHFELDNNIIKTDLEADILKDLSNEENDLKETSKSKEKTPTQQSQSFENQQKTNERILNKIIMNSNISSKISLSQSMETVKMSITNDTSSKSSLMGNSKNGPFQLKNESNAAESLKIKHKYNEILSQPTSLLQKNKSTSQSAHKIQAQPKEKNDESNIITTVPKVLIDGNNVTDDKVTNKQVEKLNEEKLNEINNEIGDEFDQFATKSSIDFQVAENKCIQLEYEEQPNISYTQPHKKLNSATISSTTLNFRSRAAKSEDKAFIQTYYLAMPIKVLEESATIKSIVGENEEIRIHINSETDLTLCVTKNKIPTKKKTSMSITEEEKYTHKTIGSDKMLSNDTLLQETLNSVYDSLVPLQEIIGNLTEEVKLLSQQQMLLGQLLSKMETKPLRIPDTHQSCKCNKN